jgi:chromosome segregation ATPase
LTAQVKLTDETLEKETLQKGQLHSTLAELEAMKLEKDASIKTKMESLSVAETEPNRIGRQAEAIDKAITSMELELKGHIKKIKYFDGELEKQAKRKTEAEKLRQNLIAKLDLNRLILIYSGHTL